LLKDSGADPAVLAQRLNLLQENNPDSLTPVVEAILKEFPLKVEEYKNGKKAILTMFMGEVMKRTKGKADPKLAADLLTRELATR
jgi:aspartyl-tRNA(Asn)/glutamyl-tRNA(Gln) amidotransferase subunit B